MKDHIIWRVGGEAGFGIMAAGTMLCRTFSRLGYHVLAVNDYPSLIRGGHNAVTVGIATKPFTSLSRELNILVALNKDSVEKHGKELSGGGVIVFDPKDQNLTQESFPSGTILLPVPLTEIVASQKGEPVMRNTVAMGATLAIMGADFELLGAVIRDQFSRKGQEVIEHNLRIAKAGFDYVKEASVDTTSFYLGKPENQESLLVINGSEAVGVGAAAAGLKFAAIYPMTPINALITFLADHAEKLNLVYKQPEDEIAGINMAIGASLTGARSMVATSGGGFALMVEGLSLAGMVETPLVIDLGMRVGPATGMPTYTEQGELQFVIHAGHGEFPRIVLAPSDALECYSLTIEAFNLADKYQLPVFILTDKHLNESQWCIPRKHFQAKVVIDRGKLATEEEFKSETGFKRYRLDVADGVSPRSYPGMPNGVFMANSYEYDETGQTTEALEIRRGQVERRLRKLRTIEKEAKPPVVYGDDAAEITFVSWGSTKGSVLEAMKLIKTKGKTCRLVHFSWLYPFPASSASQILSPVTRLIDVEQNSTGQLASLIREYTGILIKEKILKFDGRPFYPEEIAERI